MTNEELAATIKAGDTSLYAELWNQVKGIVWKRAGWFYENRRDFCAARGVTADDLAQSGFLALVDTVEDYQPESGYRFTTFLNFHLKQQFQATLDGGRRRSVQDMLNHCGSLDEPTRPDDESDALVDMVPDPDSLAGQQEAEDRIFREQMRAELDSCLESIRATQADVLRRQYYGGETLREIAEHIGRSISRAQQIRNQGLRELRKPQYSRRLLPFAEYLDVLAYRNTSFSSFRYRQASSVELAVEKLKQKPNAEKSRG